MKHATALLLSVLLLAASAGILPIPKPPPCAKPCSTATRCWCSTAVDGILQETARHEADLLALVARPTACWAACFTTA